MSRYPIISDGVCLGPKDLIAPGAIGLFVLGAWGIGCKEVGVVEPHGPVFAAFTSFA